MSTEEMDFVVSVDTSEAEEDLKQMEMHAALVDASIVSLSRKTFNSLSLLLDIAGVAIPQTIQIFASAAFMAGEMLLELGQAEFLTGALAIKALITFSMAAILFSRAAFLQGEASKAENTLNNLILIEAQWF